MKSYEEVFVHVFGDSIAGQLDALEYQGIPGWDSIGHMALIAALEDNFNVELEVDDVIDLSSFSVGKSILLKYGVAVDESTSE